MTENQINSLVMTSQNEHLTQIEEKEIYSFSRMTKVDGQEKPVTVVINNQYAVARLSNIDAIVNLNKKSNIALSIELARLRKQVAEENGFKTVAQMVHEIHPDLSETTINTYRRTGVVFGDLASEIFKWKDGIPQNASITNLGQVLGLVKIDKATDDITQEEASEAVKVFVEEYISSDRLHLLLPLMKLKDEIKNINNTIDSTSREIESKPQDSKSQDSKSQDSKPQDTKPQDSKPQDSKPQDTKPQDSKPQGYAIDFTEEDRQRLFDYSVDLMEISDIKPLQSPTYRKFKEKLVQIAKCLSEFTEVIEVSENSEG